MSAIVCGVFFFFFGLLLKFRRDDGDRSRGKTYFGKDDSAVSQNPQSDEAGELLIQAAPVGCQRYELCLGLSDPFA